MKKLKNNSITLDKKFMLLALQAAKKGSLNGEGGPFGACVVKNNKILAIANNTVLKEKNATNHAEIEAIRLASKKLNNWDLKGCTIYSTTEPCPMCFSAIHWSNIDKVVYGTTINDVKKLGFNEIMISNKLMKILGKLKIIIIPGFMKKECKELLKDYKTFLRADRY